LIIRFNAKRERNRKSDQYIRLSSRIRRKAKNKLVLLMQSWINNLLKIGKKEEKQDEWQELFVYLSNNKFVAKEKIISDGSY
jgi:hypothetical protein